MRTSGAWADCSRVRTWVLLVLGSCLAAPSPGWSRTAVFINEIMASNAKMLADPQGQFDDWIELYNADRGYIDVGGMYLTDNPLAPRKWQIPRELAGLTTITSKGYLLIWADGEIYDSGLHASFRLGAGGGSVYLFAADGVTLIDSLTFGPQTLDVSYGRSPDGGDILQFFGVPTPGQANNAGYVDEVAPLRFSHERGVYDTAFDLTITTATADAQIRYTTDGQVPNETGGTRYAPGQIYRGPLHIGGTTCVRAVATKPGWKPTAVYTHTYVLDSRAELKTLPLVSLVGNAGETFYEPAGVMAIVGGTYVGGVWTAVAAGDYDNMNDRELERPVSAEWLYAGEDAGFQIDCGLRVHGSPYTRPRYTRQQGLWSGTGKIGLRLYFRGEYGQNGLAYPLFPQSNTDQFSAVILRAGHNDETNPFIKDELVRRLYQDMGQVSCTGTFANLFINGEYKGYYNPTERIGDAACRQWFDSDKPWDVIGTGAVRDGDAVSWNAMNTYARTHNLADPAYYAELCRKLDVVSFVDFLIVRLWPNDWDWPQNNWAAACERSAAGRWKFLVWDAEGTFDSGQLTADRFGALNTQTGTIELLYQALKASPDFRQLFADRVYRHLYNGGALSDENVQRRFSDLRNTLASVIPSMSTYIVDTWTPGRRSVFLSACLREGMYTFGGPDFAINGFPQHGGQIVAGDRLSLTPSEGTGTVYYTTNGTDPAAGDLQQLPIVTALAPPDATKRILVPKGPIADAWRGGQSFDDSSWLVSAGAPGGVGFGRGAGFDAYFTTNLSSRMLNVNASCYLRIPFQFSGDNSALNAMTLKIQYDDGFIAYLNGTEVARRNFVGEPAWNSAATVSRDNTSAAVFEPIDLTAQIGLLQPGSNILALQGLNAAANNSDFLIGVELTTTRIPVTSVTASRHVYRSPIPLTRTTQIKARVTNGGVWSALSEAVFAAGPVKESLRISEIMYHPLDMGTPGDPNTEYVELTNIGAQPINLSFVQFTKGIQFTFPDMNLAPHAYCVVVKDRAAFEARYGTGLPVAGQYQGSLDDKSDLLELRDAAGAIIHSFRYQDQWLHTTDGEGYSLTIRYPASAPLGSWGTPIPWRPSAAPGGSPGWDDSGTIPADGAVVINELLANPGPGGHDWIELYNTTDRPIDLGGWFLSDSANHLTKYEIAKGTILASHGYLVFTENQHFGNTSDPGCHETFGLSRDGESVYLCSGSQGRITGYWERAKFEASDKGMTLGRWVDGVGGVHYVPLSAATPGAANAAPAVGPVVITEIMYHTGNSTDVEYVLLQNTSDANVTLYDFLRRQPWRFAAGRPGEGVELLLPRDPPLTLRPRAWVVLTKDRVLLAGRFTVPASATILEWGPGRLSDAGTTVELDRPGDAAEAAAWIGVDRVTYSDGSHQADFPTGQDPWPALADGQVTALTRLHPEQWGDNPLNWQAAVPSLGVTRPRGVR